MTRIRLNKMTSNLAAICQDSLLDEKWLIAPSLRIGFQWLDRITRSGIPAINVRIKTFPGVALELASPEMDRLGCSYLRGLQVDILIDRIFAKLKSKGEFYLTRLEQSPGLMQSISKTISDIRLSGLTGMKLTPQSFEVSAKGEEIKTILSEYEQTLNNEKLVDYADALKMAIQRIEEDPKFFTKERQFIAPMDMVEDLRGFEKSFWETIPRQNRQILEIDRPEQNQEGEINDLTLLRWFQNPKDAPSPKKDGTAAMFRAIGEVNEVREVLRRCMEKGLQFDEVEIIHTDYGTYVPLLYELGSLLNSEEDDDFLPISFAEGIPSRYSRPARALLGWVNWVKEDFPQATLVQMIQDGLLNIDKPLHDNISYTRIGAILRAVPIGRGQNRYINPIENYIQSLETKANNSLKDDEASEEYDQKRRNRLQRIEVLKILRTVIEDFVLLSQRGQSQKEILNNTSTFLDKYARSSNQLDEYSLRSYRRSISELASFLEDGEVIGLDVLDWLAALPDETKVGGLGPRPGCIYVSPIHVGGHSGRKNTFIIGMDDSRFPGTGMQDPLLLDQEREELSSQLTTSYGRLSKISKSFANLLSRLRGNVTLSYCCRSLKDDHEMFPNPILLSGYRILTGNKEGELEKLINWLSPPASFAPNTPDRCIDPTEWWLWRMCGKEKLKESEKLIADQFPHLGRGLKAREARESNHFTVYDGYVPYAVKDCDPTKTGGPLMSASRLEKIATCPMEYFFKYVLEIELPEEYTSDPNIWLDPLEKGALLHEVFRHFMTELHNTRKKPEFKRDIDLLEKILDGVLEIKKNEIPPPSEMVLEREIAELKLVTRIFLKGEEELYKESHPCYFEVALGMRQDGEPTLLDLPDPVEIKLPDGKRIYGRGQIDRIDEVVGSQKKLFDIWDYKTGSAWKYKQGPPFWSGRCIQNAFYLALVQAHLKEMHPEATINKFGYFFVSSREHGERISWSRKVLEEGKDVLALLCQMLANGCFPFTDKSVDVSYSDYILAFGEVEAVAKEAVNKLENMDNKMLEPFRKLRGYYGSEEA